MKIFWFIITFLTILRFLMKLEKNKIDVLSLFTMCYLIMVV